MGFSRFGSPLSARLFRIPRKMLVIFAGVAIFCLAGCRVGPEYQRPVVAAPSEFRWKPFEPTTALPVSTVCVSSWSIFNDAKLDELEKAALEGNQDIRLALARVDETRAQARLNKADFFPQVSAQPTFRRQEQSGGTFIPGISSFAGPSGIGSIPGFRKPFNDFLVPLNVSYEADVWGRVRRSVEAGQDRAEASIADYESIRLTAAADVAANYFLLRSLDSQIDVFKKSIDLRKQSLDLVSKRVTSGVADDLDLNRGKTELATASATLADLKRQREQAVNALAILCGTPASNFLIDPKTLCGEPPEIPIGLPSALLERRPDVVRAERLLAASCQDIGIAKAAYFPRLSLTASGGFESDDLTQLFRGPSTAWNVVANVVQPVFTGGRNKAQLDAAKARYEESLAQYRQQTLIAFKDVEDALIDLRFLTEQSKALIEATDATRKVTQLAMARYDAGRINYFDVVDAERQQLAVEQQSVQILGQRLVAAARLIKALGGGWISETAVAGH